MSAKEKADRWLYLFSSNTNPLYATDALTALSLPAGWRQHFRYEEKYVHKALWASLPESTGKHTTLEVKGVVLSFVHQEVESKKYTVHGLYPLRLGTLVRGYRDGGVAHFWFQVGEHLLYDEDGGVRHFEALKHALVGQDPTGGLYASLGASYGITGVEDDTARSRAFESVARTISGKGLREDATVFVLFHGIKQLKKGKDPESLPPLGIQHDFVGRESNYQLVDGRLYGVELTFHNAQVLNESCLSEASIELQLDPDRFGEVGRRFLPLKGRYDRVVLPFTTKLHTGDEWGAIRVWVDSRTDASRLDAADQVVVACFRASEWWIPTYVKVSRWRRFWWAGANLLFEGLAVAGTAVTAALVGFKQELHWIAISVAALAVGAIGKTAIRIFFPNE